VSIDARHISKSFGGQLILENVDLVVPGGSLVALLGPSGSGKTTLLRILAGLEQADPGSGPITFAGQDVEGLSVGERRVGFVFQNYALFKHMTVFENIAFGLRVRPRSRRPASGEIIKRVEGLLELVQLEMLAERYPAQLSGGQRQRVALARALAIEPQVLLLDEPFGALDAQVRLELRRWLRNLHEEIHVTSVFVTHDQEEALEISDQVVVMNRGRIEQAGTPDEVYHDPSTEFVMGFLGQVNRFEGSVERGRLLFGPWSLATPTGSSSEGRPVRVYMRPHDFEIDVSARVPGSVRSDVLQLFAAGPVVRLELRTPQGGILRAELSQRRLLALGLREGSQVFVSPRTWRVYA
jgi:sulfate/thiosulfate transport system ATP-binding protein